MYHSYLYVWQRVRRDGRAPQPWLLPCTNLRCLSRLQTRQRRRRPCRRACTVGPAFTFWGGSGSCARTAAATAQPLQELAAALCPAACGLVWPTSRWLRPCSRLRGGGNPLSAPSPPRHRVTVPQPLLCTCGAAMGTTAALWLPCRQRNHAKDAEFPTAAMIERGAAAVAHHAAATATAATIAAAANAHDRAACRFPRLTNGIKMAVPASSLTAGGH